MIGMVLAAILLVAAGLALMLRRPAAALAVVFLAATIQMPVVGRGGLDLKVSELIYFAVAVVLLPGCLVRIRADGEWRPTDPGPDGWILLAMLGTIALSYPVRILGPAMAGDHFLFSVMHFVRFAFLTGALFLLQGRLIPGDEDRVVVWVGLAIAVSAIVALVTFELGIWVSVDVLNSVKRARGTFINGNQLAAFHVCALPFLLAGALRSRQRTGRAVCGLGVVLSLFTVLQSESKMGILVLLMDVALAPLLLLRGRQSVGLLLGATAVFSVAFFAMGLGGRFLKVFTAMASGGFLFTEEAARLYLWQAGAEAVGDHWLFGTGFFTTQFHSVLNWNGKLFGTYHSFYLDYFSSNGIVPFLLLIAWLVRPLLTGWRLAKRRRNVAAGAACLVIINVLVMIAFENYLMNVATPLLLAAAMVWIRRMEDSHGDVAARN